MSRSFRAAALQRIDWRVVLFAVMAASALFVGSHLDRSWFPVDDGALAHSAERVLRGELPHRDFDDVYTGGLAWLNAAAFRLFGTSFWALRLVLFAAFMAWVPSVFYVATRFVRPLPAAAVTLLAMVWSVPAYVAPMPSWYNLFLATFGIAAFMRWLEDRRARWLVLAGVAGGLSVLVKVVGLYYVAGALLFLVFQAREEAAGAATPADARHPVAYRLFVTGTVLLFACVLVSLVRRAPYLPELLHFVLPGLLLAAMLVRDEWRSANGGSLTRFTTLGRALLPFAAGIALPVAIFLVPYLRAGAVADVVNGVFVLPARRFANASVRMLPLWSLLTLLLPASILLRHRAGGKLARRAADVVLAVGLVAVTLYTARSTLLYRIVWDSARSMVPVLTVLGVMLLSRGRPDRPLPPLLRARTMLLLSVTAVCSLVQFPFSVAVYFCYVAPLVVLSALALYRFLPPMPRMVPVTLVGLYAGFAVLRIDLATQFGMGRFYLPESRVSFQTMTGTRANIEAPHASATEYQAVTYLLQVHARGGYTWASPDSPEMYFLSGLRNPTRTLYDFFEDSTGRTERVLHMLDARGVTAIVENGKPPFSAPLAPALVTALESRYPNAAQIGPYLVRWR